MKLQIKIDKIRDIKDYENIPSLLGLKGSKLLYEIVDSAERMDKELDIIHELLTELYNDNNNAIGNKVKKALDKIEKI